MSVGGVFGPFTLNLGLRDPIEGADWNTWRIARAYLPAAISEGGAKGWQAHYAMPCVAIETAHRRDLPSSRSLCNHSISPSAPSMHDVN